MIATVGIAYSYYLGNNLRYPDEHDYYTIALNLVRSYRYTTDGQNPTAFRPPGYPFILSILSLLSPSIILLRSANFIALSISSYLTYLIVKKQSSPIAAIIGGLLVVGYPVLFYTAGTLYPQTIAGCLFLTVIYLISQEYNSWGVALIIGFLLGYLVLMIPTFVIVPIVFFVWSWLNNERNRTRVAAIVAVAFLVVGMWTVRNYAAFRSFVFVSSNSGLNLLLGNSENTTPNAGVNVDISRYTSVGSKLNEIDSDAYYRSKAIEFVRDNKIYAMKLYFLKFINYFNYTNELYVSSESSNLRNIVVFVTYNFILLVVLLRIVAFKCFKISEFEVLLLLLYISHALLSAIFFTRIRFRLPFDFLIIIIAAMFLGNVINTMIGEKAASFTASRKPASPRI